MKVLKYGPDEPLKTAREAEIWWEAQERARVEERERCAKAIEDYVLLCPCGCGREVPLDDSQRFVDAIRALK